LALVHAFCESSSVMRPTGVTGWPAAVWNGAMREGIDDEGANTEANGTDIIFHWVLMTASMSPTLVHVVGSRQLPWLWSLTMYSMPDTPGSWSKVGRKPSG
jgi:hypothetical protein